MDGILLFNNPIEDDTEDLPWVKDWLKSSPIADEPQEVLDCYAGDKGLLVITGQFKMFLFKKQSEYKFLLEALETWVRTGEEVHPVIAVRVNKKVALGINQKAPKVVWHLDENKFYSRRVDDSPAIRNPSKINPFLSPTVPHETQAKEQLATTKAGK